MQTIRRTTLAVLQAADELLSSIDHEQRAGLDSEERVALMRLSRRVGDRIATLSHVLTDEVNQAQASMPATGTPITSVIALDEQRDAKEAAGQVFHAAAVNKHQAARDAALAGDISERHAAAIAKGMAELPSELPPEVVQQAEELFVQKAAETTPKKLAKLAPLVLAEVAPELARTEEQRAASVEAQRERAVSRRSFQYGDDGDGSVWFKGSLPEAEATPLIRTVEAFVERDRRASRNRQKDLHDLKAGPGEIRAQRVLDTRRTPAQRRADALVEMLDHVRDTPKTIGDRPRVVVTVSMEDLVDGALSAGVLPSGQELPAGQLRRILCDADVMPVVMGSQSEILDVGRTSRLVTPAIRRALSLRDGGCIFPNCDVPDSGCDAHHIVPWWMSGVTALHNLVLLCPHHHALVEPDRSRRPEDSWRVGIDGESGLPQIAAPGKFVDKRREAVERESVDDRRERMTGQFEVIRLTIEDLRRPGFKLRLAA